MKATTQSIPVIKDPPTVSLTLELSPREAEGLITICARINGLPGNQSARGVADAIYNALAKAGFYCNHNEYSGTVVCPNYHGE